MARPKIISLITFVFYFSCFSSDRSPRVRRTPGKRAWIANRTPWIARGVARARETLRRSTDVVRLENRGAGDIPFVTRPRTSRVRISYDRIDPFLLYLTNSRRPISIRRYSRHRWYGSGALPFWRRRNARTRIRVFHRAKRILNAIIVTIIMVLRRYARAYGSNS